MTDLPLKICVTKIENKITLKVETSCYLKLLTLETMKLITITENENSENMPY